MATRSLFSPFSNSVSPYAARNIGGLFNNDNIEISPEYLALLQSGVEPSEEMLMSTPMFKGGRVAKLANAKAVESMVQAKFGDTLSTKREKELIPFRASQELEKQKEFSKFGRQQAKEVEEENLSELGTALGPQLGNLPTEQLSSIIPEGTVFGSPADQARSYMAKVGQNTPVSKAVIETSPDVIRGRVGEEANKRFLKLGSDYAVDTANNSFIQGGSYQPETTFELVPSGKMVPRYDEAGHYVGMQPEMVPKSTTSQNYKPGRVGKLVATQADFDSIAKESGANYSTKEPPQAPPYEIGEEAASIPSPLPNLLLGTDNKPKIKSNEATQYEGAIPTVLGAVDSVNKAAMKFPMQLNTKLAEGMENLIPSKEIQPLVDTAGEGIKGLGQGLNVLRQSLIKGVGEKPQKVTARDPLSLYLDMINKGLTTGGNVTSEILQGIMSPSPDTKPYGKPVKKKKKDYRNFSLENR